jgi:hypothetical protein
MMADVSLLKFRGNNVTLPLLLLSLFILEINLPCHSRIAWVVEKGRRRPQATQDVEGSGMAGPSETLGRP